MGSLVVAEGEEGAGFWQGPEGWAEGGHAVVFLLFFFYCFVGEWVG